MAAIKTTTNTIIKKLFNPLLYSLSPKPVTSTSFPISIRTFHVIRRGISFAGIRCAASDSGDGGKKVSARLSQVHQSLKEAEERFFSVDNEAIPKITLEKIMVSLRRHPIKLERYTEKISMALAQG